MPTDDANNPDASIGVSKPFVNESKKSNDNDLEKKIYQATAPSRFLNVFTSAIPALIGTVVAVISLFSSADVFRELFDRNKNVTTIPFDLSQTKLISQVDELKIHLKTLDEKLSQFHDLSPTEKGALAIRGVQADIKAISDRQEKIESVISTNPSKALEMILMQRDLDNLKSSVQANNASLRDNVDKIYDLNKWLLGAMAVSIVTLAVGSFMKNKDA